MTKLSILSLGLSLLLAAKAQAKVEIFVDQGLPRCIQNTGDGKHGMILLWKAEEQYQREIKAVRIDQINAVSTLNPIQDPSCANWADLIGDAAMSPTSMTVAPEAQSIGNVPLPQDLQGRLLQIRQGANEFHPELTGEDYLRNHPLDNFTVETNRELTKRFGIGFTGKIYKSWILADPANSNMVSMITNGMAQVNASSGPFLQAQFKNRHAFFVKGLGNDQISSQRYDFLPQLLSDMGIPVTIIKTGAYDHVDESAVIVQTKLDQVLSTGADVMVFSLSKGTIESLLAISRLNSKLDGRLPGYGRVRAYISLSGIYDSSFLLNFVSKPVIDDLATHFIKKDYKMHDQIPPKDIMAGIRDLTDKRVRAFQNEIKANGIPQETNYFSLVGIIPNFGLSNDSGISPIQKLTRPLLGPGANDGYVEYPGTQFPKALAAKSFAVPVDSSHVFIDGQFQGKDMSKPEDRRVVIGSFMSQVGNILDKEDRQ